MNRPRLVALLGSGAVASQAGHLLIYQLQFGSAAQAVQSTGAHAYFPALAKTSLGMAALVALGALLMVGASRLLAIGPGTRIIRGPSYFHLLAALFTIQITCFLMQETIESTVAGMPLGLAPHLFLLGTLGQLPIAVLAALAFKWLSARVETAIATLRNLTPVRVVDLGPIAVLLSTPPPAPQLALAAACPAAFIKRGPPPFLRS